MPWNDPPQVWAGSNLWTDLRDIRLAGAVRDDGRPYGRLTTRWELLHGPGPVVFEDAAALTTTVKVASSGDYTLRLVADDGELWRSALLELRVLPPGARIEQFWDFQRPLDRQGWSAHNTGTVTQEWENCRSLPVDYVGGGHWIVAFNSARGAQLRSRDELDLEAARVPVLAIKVLNRTNADRMRVRWTTTDSPEFDGERHLDVAMRTDDDLPEWYFAPVGSSPHWRGRIRQLCLEFATPEPVTGTLRFDDLALGRWPLSVSPP